METVIIESYEKIIVKLIKPNEYKKKRRCTSSYKLYYWK